MELSDLPIEKMHIEVSMPRQEALDFLADHFVAQYLEKKYRSEEDLAEAFDGAFTAFHIYAHLSKGGDRETWLAEVLGWYDLQDKKDLSSPFYDGLKTTLGTCGLEFFFDEAVDYIIDNKGSIDEYLMQ